MNEDVKIYRFAREYRDSLVPSEEEKTQALRENFLEKFTLLKIKIKRIKETDKSNQNEEKIGVAEELIEKCEETYGKDLERLDSISEMKKIKKTDESNQNEEKIGEAKELIEKCEKIYGKDLERLDLVSDWKLKSFYSIVSGLINELEVLEEKEENPIEIVE